MCRSPLSPTRTRTRCCGCTAFPSSAARRSHTVSRGLQDTVRVSRTAEGIPEAHQKKRGHALLRAMQVTTIPVQSTCVCCKSLPGSEYTTGSLSPCVREPAMVYVPRNVLLYRRSLRCAVPRCVLYVVPTPRDPPDAHQLQPVSCVLMVPTNTYCGAFARSCRFQCTSNHCVALRGSTWAWVQGRRGQWQAVPPYTCRAMAFTLHAPGTDAQQGASPSASTPGR